MVQNQTSAIDMNDVACVILGGGQGTRLFPLTSTRCKPAICFGGRYRLIDVPLSNSLNSGCHKIFIVTQFLSSTLHRHIFQTYHLGAFDSGFIEVLAAEQRPTNANSWFQGTADAVRQNLEYILDVPAEYYLILSGDQLYHIDFAKMVAFAKSTDADLTIASLPVDQNDAKRMGILKVDSQERVVDFYEKPQEKGLFANLQSYEPLLEKIGIPSDSARRYFGSMGIYLFKRKTLAELLKNDTRHDFGKHLIPTKVQQGGVYAYICDSFWEDIGTIDSFYKTNIALTQPNPPFDCYNEINPIHTSRNNLAGPKIIDTQIKNSIICEGSIVEADSISNSILGPRSVIKKGTRIQDSYVMGNDFYTHPVKNPARSPEELSIGENCIIKKAILDNNVLLGKRVQLVNKNNLSHYDGDNIYIRDGIIIVNRGAHLPDDFIL